MAEALLRTQLGGIDVEVGSAGLLAGGHPAAPKALRVMKSHGIDLSNHSSVHVRVALETPPDLILAMASEHLRALTKIDPSLLDRAFTLKEFASLVSLEGERMPGEPMASYLRRVSASRSRSFIFSNRRDLDIPDPIGGRRSAFSHCARELRELVQRVGVLLYPVAERRSAG